MDISNGLQSMKQKILALMPLLLIILLLLAGYCIAFFNPWSWNTLKELQATTARFHDAHPIWTPILFMLLYIVCALFSFPGIFILSLLAGFLFRQPYSTLYVTFASTIGACLLFLVARTAFGKLLYRKASHRLLSLKNGFLENAASYLLFLRLFPLFPYWLVNLAGAFFTVRLRTFAWTTFVGMIPSVYIYAQAGRGFAKMLNDPEPLSPSTLLSTNMIIALIGLSALSLVPLLFTKAK